MQTVREAGRALVIAFNKWDLVDEERRYYLDREIERDLVQVQWAPRINITARTGWHVDRLVPALEAALAGWETRVAHRAAERLPGPARRRAPAPGAQRASSPRSCSGPSPSTAPPTFVLFTSACSTPATCASSSAGCARSSASSAPRSTSSSGPGRSGGVDRLCLTVPDGCRTVSGMSRFRRLTLVALLALAVVLAGTLAPDVASAAHRNGHHHKKRHHHHKKKHHHKRHHKAHPKKAATAAVTHPAAAAARTSRRTTGGTATSAPCRCTPTARVALAHVHPRDLHPDFGGPYGIPVTCVTSAHPKVPVSFDYADESDHVGYPFGADTRIEGGRGSGGDMHAVVVDRSACRLYETWDTTESSGHWRAGSGATWSLRSRRAAPRRLDLRRCRRAADLPGPAALRRGQGRPRRPRDPVHHRPHQPPPPVAGPPRRRVDQHLGLPADGGAVPAAGVVRHQSGYDAQARPCSRR